MFKRFLKNRSKGTQKEPELTPPFQVGETIDLIKGVVDFQVQNVAKNLFTDSWYVSGKAIVKLSFGAREAEIREISDHGGIIRSFAIHYTIGGKKVVLCFGRLWSRYEDRGKEAYDLTINEVEVL